jgi:hypothetical protein
MHARFDQCVRVSDSRDAGLDQGPAASDAPHEDADVTPPRPGDASDSSLPGDGEPDAACDPDYFLRGGRCMLREIHVDAMSGDDERDGARARPLKTFARAMRAAVDGQIVSFAPGVYRVDAYPDAGPATAGVVPAGITLRTQRNVSDRAVLDGGGEHSLTFLGGATVEDMDLVDFVAPVVASVGEQTLTNVGISHADSPVTLVAQAHLICDGCRFEGEPVRLLTLMTVSGTATATLKRSTLLTESDDCHLPMTALIDVGGSANLVLDDAQLSGAFYTGVLLRTRGSARIRSSKIEDGCGSKSLQSRHEPAGPTPTNVEIEDSEFWGSAEFESGMQRVRARRSIFHHSFSISWPVGGVYDLGMPARDGGADPGGNTIQQLLFIGAGLTIFASGNQWHPNAQGSDGAGHFPEGRVLTVAPGESVNGENFLMGVMSEPAQVFF